MRYLRIWMIHSFMTMQTLTASPSRIMMIPPTHFRVNKEALNSNVFMSKRTMMDEARIREVAMAEHAALATVLVERGVDVRMMDAVDSEAVDAVFCNNWISVHHPWETGKDRVHVVVHSMALENRQREVRDDIIEKIVEGYYEGDVSPRVTDLRWIAYGGVGVLESTGSMVIDRWNRTVYATLSPRTYLLKLMAFCELMDYELCFFNSMYEGKPVYHTNVMMAMGQGWAVICPEIIHESQREKVWKRLAKRGVVVEITAEQMRHYCGNILEVVGEGGRRLIVMSTRAEAAFGLEQLQMLKEVEGGREILAVPCTALETFGGGGVRCCLAEV